MNEKIRNSLNRIEAYVFAMAIIIILQFMWIVNLYAENARIRLDLQRVMDLTHTYKGTIEVR